MFNKEYYLFSLVQPGSNSNILKESVKETVEQLSMNDFLVISSGINDFDSDNFTSAFQNIRNYLMSITNTNILLLNIPYRFDLPNYLTVNKKILMLNKKLQKLVRLLPHTKFLNSNNDRHLFTRHGLHRNKLGKRLITSQMVCHILAIFQHRSPSPIPLERSKPTDETTSLSNNKQEETKTRNSSRQTKPIARSDDFLW